MNRLTGLAWLTIAALVACQHEPRQARIRAAVTRDTLQFPPPDRPISSIVAARWSDETDRDRLREPDNVVRISGIRTGMTVADIGAGDGYYVARLSPIVGANGRVIGEDIVPEYLDLLRRRVASDQLTNATVVQGTPGNPGLPPRSVDVALLIHMYHEITQPFELLWNLSGSMKRGGIVAILDQNSSTDRHGTPPSLLRCELAAVGYEYVRAETLEDGAYVAVFRVSGTVPSPKEITEALKRTPCMRPF